MRLLALPLLVLLGCSSSDGGGSAPAGSSGGASGGTSGCDFSGTLTGGVSGAIAVNGCGTSTSAVFSIAQTDFAKGTSLGVRFKLKTALRGGELGPQPLESFEVFQIEAKGAPEVAWSSAACTLELDKSERAATTVFKNRFDLAGRGSCATALDPQAPSTRPSVTVSPFEFRAFVNP